MGDPFLLLWAWRWPEPGKQAQPFRGGTEMIVTPERLFANGPVRALAQPAEMQIDSRGLKCLLEVGGGALRPAGASISAFRQAHDLFRPSFAFRQGREVNFSRRQRGGFPVQWKDTSIPKEHGLRIVFAVDERWAGRKEQGQPFVLKGAEFGQPRKAPVQRARELSRATAPAAIVSRVISFEEGRNRAQVRPLMGGVEPADPTGRRIHGQRLADVLFHADVAHADAAVHVFENEPGFAGLLVGVRAEAPWPEARIAPQDTVIDFGFVRDAAAVSEGNVPLPGLVFDEQPLLAPIRQPTDDRFVWERAHHLR